MENNCNQVLPDLGNRRGLDRCPIRGAECARRRRGMRCAAAHPPAFLSVRDRSQKKRLRLVSLANPNRSNETGSSWPTITRSYAIQHGPTPKKKKKTNIAAFELFRHLIGRARASNQSETIVSKKNEAPFQIATQDEIALRKVQLWDNCRKQNTNKKLDEEKILQKLLNQG